MNDDILSKVLDEILKEQKEIRNLILIRIQKGDKEAENFPNVFEKLGEVIQKLEAAVIAYSQQPLDMPRLEEAITKEVKRLRQAIEGQPKEVTVNKRVLLFSEGWALQNFKTLFTGLLALIIIGFILFEVHLSMGARDNLHYKKAWQWLYNNQNEDGKQRLEKILLMSGGPKKQPLNQEK